MQFEEVRAIPTLVKDPYPEITEYFRTHSDAKILKIHWLEFGKPTKKQAYQAAARWCQITGAFSQKMRHGDDHIYLTRLEEPQPINEDTPSRPEESQAL